MTLRYALACAASTYRAFSLTNEAIFAGRLSFLLESPITKAPEGGHAGSRKAEDSTLFRRPEQTFLVFLIVPVGEPLGPLGEETL